MSVQQILIYAFVLPVAAWLVATVLERVHARAEARRELQAERPRKPVDPRIMNLYLMVSTAYASLSFWQQNNKFASGALSVVAVMMLVETVKAFRRGSTAAAETTA